MKSLSDLIRAAVKATPDTILIALGALFLGRAALSGSLSTIGAVLMLVGLGWRESRDWYDTVSYVNGEGERLQPGAVVRCALLFGSALALVIVKLWPRTI